MNFNVLNKLSDDDEEEDQQCVIVRAGKSAQKRTNADVSAAGYLIDLFDQGHHQDSTSVCPDSAASKKRKP